MEVLEFQAIYSLVLENIDKSTDTSVVVDLDLVVVLHDPFGSSGPSYS
jgi:hypothetical protein